MRTPWHPLIIHVDSHVTSSTTTSNKDCFNLAPQNLEDALILIGFAERYFNHAIPSELAC